ncbi:MAG: heavy-metal-associated domain-containing protein [Gemmatimonadales bacterium]|nr:heavy-metal-associated domain-containing protein [Gemmatimonadales bacterium]
MKELTLHIEGMSCSHCLNAVNKALAGQPGVTIESVQIGRAQLRYDPGATSPDQLLAAIDRAGYRAAVGTAP